MSEFILYDALFVHDMHITCKLLNSACERCISDYCLAYLLLAKFKKYLNFIFVENYKILIYCNMYVSFLFSDMRSVLISKINIFFIVTKKTHCDINVLFIYDYLFEYDFVWNSFHVLKI